MKRLVAAAVLLVAGTRCAAAQQFYQQPITPVDASATVGTSVVQLAPATPASNARSYFRIELLTSGGLLFCTFDGTTPGIGVVGSHPFIGQGANEEDALSRGDLVPQGPIKCISTSVVAVTLKVYPQ